MASRSRSLNCKREWANDGSSIELLDLLRVYATIVQSCSVERSLQLFAAMTEYLTTCEQSNTRSMDGVARVVERRIQLLIIVIGPAAQDSSLSFSLNICRRLQTAANTSAV